MVALRIQIFCPKLYITFSFAFSCLYLSFHETIFVFYFLFACEMFVSEDCNVFTSALKCSLQDTCRGWRVGKLVRYAFQCFPEAHDAAKCKLSKLI